MTIKRGILGSLVILIGMMIALGANSLWALADIAREARYVEAEVGRTGRLIELNVQIRNVVAKAVQYTMSETEFDRDVLNTAIKELKSSAKRPQQSGSGDPVETLATGIVDFLPQVDAISALVDTRRNSSIEAAEAMTDLEVLSTAIADASGPEIEPMRRALKMVECLESSGIALFHYRASRQPADIAGAGRWLALGRQAYTALSALPGTPRLHQLLEAAADPLTRYGRALSEMHAST